MRFLHVYGSGGKLFPWPPDCRSTVWQGELHPMRLSSGPVFDVRTGEKPVVGQLRGRGGYSVDSALALLDDRGGAQMLQHFRCAALFEPSQWVSGDPVGGRTSASPRGAWPCSARSARSSNAAIFASSKLSQVRVGSPRCWSMSEASGFLHAARPRSADPWGMLETCSNIPMGIDTKYRWRAPEGRPDRKSTRLNSSHLGISY